MLKKRPLIIGDDDICLYSDDDSKKVAAALPPLTPPLCTQSSPPPEHTEPDTAHADKRLCVSDDSSSSSAQEELEPSFFVSASKKVSARDVMRSRKHRLHLSPTMYGLDEQAAVLPPPAEQLAPGALLSRVDLADSSDDADSQYETDKVDGVGLTIVPDESDSDSSDSSSADSSDSGAEILVALQHKKRGPQLLMCVKAIIIHYVRGRVDASYTVSVEEGARGRPRGDAAVKMHSRPLELARRISELYPQAAHEFALLREAQFARSEWSMSEGEEAPCTVCALASRPIRWKVPLSGAESAFCCVWCVKVLQCFNTLARFWTECAQGALDMYRLHPAGASGLSVFTLRRLLEQIEQGHFFEEFVDAQYRRFCGLKALVAENADAVYKKELERRAKQETKLAAAAAAAAVTTTEPTL